jgi:transposase
LTVKARRDRLDTAIGEMAADSEFTDMVHRLGCLRGVSTLTGFALAVEIGDRHRFTGNTHVRRLLVEAAWHHRARYTVGKTMRDRWELAPAAAGTRGDEGNRRLHQRWVKFIDRKKKPTIANVAIARELAGWCWSLAVLEE